VKAIERPGLVVFDGEKAELGHHYKKKKTTDRTDNHTPRALCTTRNLPEYLGKNKAVIERIRKEGKQNQSREFHNPAKYQRNADAEEKKEIPNPLNPGFPLPENANRSHTKKKHIEWPDPGIVKVLVREKGFIEQYQKQAQHKEFEPEQVKARMQPPKYHRHSMDSKMVKKRRSEKQFFWKPGNLSKQDARKTSHPQADRPPLKTGIGQKIMRKP
jgi:hypothetical protein